MDLRTQPEGRDRERHRASADRWRRSGRHSRRRGAGARRASDRWSSTRRHSGAGRSIARRLVPDERSLRDLYGSEAAKATALHETFAAMADRIDYWPKALVWNVGDNVADIAVDGRNSPHRIHSSRFWPPARPTGCCPFAGWTTPGVFSLGGAQVALKSQGCAIGERVVFLRLRAAAVSRGVAIHESRRGSRCRPRHGALLGQTQSPARCSPCSRP